MLHACSMSVRLHHRTRALRRERDMARTAGLGAHCTASLRSAHVQAERRRLHAHTKCSCRQPDLWLSPFAGTVPRICTFLAVSSSHRRGTWETDPADRLTRSDRLCHALPTCMLALHCSSSSLESLPFTPDYFAGNLRVQLDDRQVMPRRAHQQARTKSRQSCSPPTPEM